MMMRWAILALILTILASTEGVDDDDHIQILEHLRSTFRVFRTRNQFAVLYMPPPNAPAGRVSFRPFDPDITYRGGVYPRNPQSMRQNYAAATPQRNEQGDIVHTEDALLSMVFPYMHQWYFTRHGQTPRVIYMFTHFLPCEDCFQIIQNTQNENQNMQIYVGYTDLFGGASDLYSSCVISDIECQGNQLETLWRENALNIYLREHTGQLFRLLDDNDVCGQQGESTSRRIKRAVQQNTCPSSSRGRLFIITMDFSSGKTLVEYRNIPANNYGWIGLYNNIGRRQTWHWTYQKTSGLMNFGSYYISDGDEVRYYNGFYERDLAITSSKWKACGFGWTRMNKLPSSYGKVELKLTVEDGYIRVNYWSDDPSKYNHWDYIAIQATGQAKGQWDYQWVSRLKSSNNKHDKLKRGKRSSDNNVKFYISWRPDSKLEEGFRLKYVYNLWGRGYQYGEYIRQCNTILDTERMPRYWLIT